MVKREIVEILMKFRSAVKKNGIQVTKIILYGSHATGKYDKCSDIDVAIVSPDFGKDRFKEGSRLFQIAYKIDPRIEPIPISSKSYEKDTWIPLIYEIKARGLELKHSG